MTRWRLHKLAFCANIEIIFRQIEISPKYVDLQRIIWSPTPNDPVEHYVLTTVIYTELLALHISLYAC